MDPARKPDYRVEVDLPADAFAHATFERDDIAALLRVLWLVELVRERRLGYGKAAELAEMPKAAFVQVMARHGVSPVDFDSDDVLAELAAAHEVAG